MSAGYRGVRRAVQRSRADKADRDADRRDLQVPVAEFGDGEFSAAIYRLQRFLRRDSDGKYAARIRELEAERQRRREAVT